MWSGVQKQWHSIVSATRLKFSSLLRLQGGPHSYFPTNPTTHLSCFSSQGPAGKDIGLNVMCITENPLEMDLVENLHTTVF
jgi:hypothetical protein